MPDDFIELIAATAMDVAAQKAARRYRWLRILGVAMRAFFVVVVLAVIVVTFAYW